VQEEFSARIVDKEAFSVFRPSPEHSQVSCSVLGVWDTRIEAASVIIWLLLTVGVQRDWFRADVLETVLDTV